MSQRLRIKQVLGEG